MNNSTRQTEHIDALDATSTRIDSQIANIAAYKFVALEELQTLRDELKQRCKQLALRGTILLSPEGINLFLAGTPPAVAVFLQQLRSQAEFNDLEVKFSYSDSQPFNRMLVKIKREIIAFGVEGIAPEKRTSPKLSARELKQWLDEGRPVRLLDTRNDYEVDLGTFHGAERLGIQHFRDFPEASSGLPEEARHEPLVMFCTGGIRCEKAGPMLEQLGFEQVYQLDGGILKYFEECGGAHYEGGCFVFDSRVVLGPDLKPTGAVQCFHCQAVLTHEDIQSEKFLFGRFCPHCYRTPDQQQQDRLSARQLELSRVADAQPGCQPYDNRRLMHVAARFAGLTLIEFLQAYHPPTPRERWLEWLAAGSITSMGQPCDPSASVREGQQFEQIERGYTEPPVASDVELIYEDDAIVVVNKPAPLPVHASGRYNRNTLDYWLSRVYRPEKLRLANRLDAVTSGLVVLARKYSAARVLQPQFADGRAQKKYLLRVSGHPADEQFHCDKPIGRQVEAAGSRQIDDQGDRAVTEFQLLRRYADGTSLLEARPLTGRTHQIRLHAQHLGLPIVGDDMYGMSQDMSSREPIADSADSRAVDLRDLPSLSRDIQSHAIQLHAIQLHAWVITFVHPFTGRPVTFEAAKPTWASDAS